MKNDQWEINRAGLVNFWYYDEETFQFEDGKLLLRGANGSGKSVTMQSFLPVLLDGRKSPDRLDPFGSKARRMEDYLLGEKEVVDRDERTGYLFIEYVKKETGQYMTTGIGMQAKRNKQLKSWYFIITDNRRIGKDFSLTLTHTGEKIPMSEKELTNRIASGGYVVGTQKEYMELVNRYVFGFQSIEAYEDLIKLLIQLRSPKLSKDFKPTVIYEILESALPPLTDDEIRYLSESIDHMDQVQQELESLERQKESIQKVLHHYDRYNRYVIAEKAEQWSKAEQHMQRKQSEVQELEEKLAELEEEITELESSEKKLETELDILEKEKDQLNKHEVWALEEKRQDLQKDVIRKQEEFDWKDNKRSNKQVDYLKKIDELNTFEAEEAHLKKEINELIEEMSACSVETDFLTHEVNTEDFKRMNAQRYDFSVWKQEVRLHENQLSEVLKLVEEKERQELSYIKLERKSSEQKQQVDQTVQQIEHTEQYFVEEQQKLETCVFKWVRENETLTYTDQERQEISRVIKGLYEYHNYDQVKLILNEGLDRYRETIQTDFINKQNDGNTLKETIAEKEQELNRLKTQRMIEPERHEGTIKHRAQLKEQGTLAVPFYEAVAFFDHVPDEVRSRVEAVLTHTGVLDSLLSNSEVEPVEDSILQENPYLMTETLADYLKPDLEDEALISIEKVNSILRSIPIQETDGVFSIDLDGSYSMGIVRGHAPALGAPRFIGRASRKRYLKKKLDQLSDELKGLKEEESEVEKELDLLQERLHQIKEWQRSIPTDKELLAIADHKKELENQLKIQRAVLDQTDQQWKEVMLGLSRLEQSLYSYKSTFSFTLTTELIQEAIELFKEYAGYLHQLENTTVQYHAINHQVTYLAEVIHDIEEELDRLKGEMNIDKDLLDKLSREIESIEHQLQLKGVEEIRQEIQRVQSMLQETKETHRSVINEIPQKRADRQKVGEQLQTNRKEADFWSRMEKLWEQSISMEVQLAFVELDEMEKLNAQYILKMHGELLTTSDKSKIQEQLTKAMLEEQSLLSEYRMAQQTESADIPQWMQNLKEERFEAYVKEYRAQTDRRLIRMYYNGTQTNPYYVAELITKIYEEQVRNLDEQDRKLYEDIMLNHIGTILRSRIKRAAKWVKQMDQIMSQRDNSSGLIFSIAWKAQTAESEDEMDTAELVKLLERDSKFLKEDDLTKITRHFQSRITKAKELISLRNEGSTLHQVLKEVLDYRKWFTFVLSFKRENERVKRELTNNAFFQFSGGEKAMAMYIPLFTAAYSRYKEASDSAPYIISLDEAFAGVDENNIRDMFEVVEQLGFNYVMNSQALWGDYDTVPSLAIAELLRPKNADFVTVMRYRWDGNTREPVALMEDEVDGQLEFT
ncbi:TIGR02680 family protein [Alkalihalophilus pseudofirmus]|uniref:TIGR02680 family protein n=1 Tax=Alkalihalophilus pseudofirmus TaxID=79885 RepID=UPI000951C2B9|nr:TIGR02680 family protein [Alkalihalophilus pseudofirmus]